MRAESRRPTLAGAGRWMRRVSNIDFREAEALKLNVHMQAANSAPSSVTETAFREIDRASSCLIAGWPQVARG
jgi:hypothetical protein